MTKDEALVYQTMLREQSWRTPLGRTLAQEAIDALAARVRELEGRTCDRCKHRRSNTLSLEPDWCAHLSEAGHHLPCTYVGNTCGAFKEKTT